MARNLRTAYAIHAPVHIEFEDNDYLYISSEYRWKDIKGDVEDMKVPITIIYGKPQATNR